MTTRKKSPRKSRNRVQEQLANIIGVRRDATFSTEKDGFGLSLKTRMKELREKYHLTQEELADMVGVRRETILFLEKGKYNPSLKLAYSIARVLKSKIEDVFTYE